MRGLRSIVLGLRLTQYNISFFICLIRRKWAIKMPVVTAAAMLVQDGGSLTAHYSPLITIGPIVSSDLIKLLCSFFVPLCMTLCRLTRQDKRWKWPSWVYRIRTTLGPNSLDGIFFFPFCFVICSREIDCLLIFQTQGTFSKLVFLYKWNDP